MVRGNPRLNPSIVDNYELGWRRQIAAIEGRIGLAGFYQVNRALGSSIAAYPAPIPSAAALTVNPINLGNLRVYGVEASADGTLAHGFDWGVEYRLAMVEGRLPNTASVDYQHASPRHLVSSRLGWGTGPAQANLFLRYASSTAGWRSDAQGLPVYVSVDDYVSAGGRLAYQLGSGLAIALEGANLVSGRQTQTVGFQARRQVFLSLTANF